MQIYIQSNSIKNSILKNCHRKYQWVASKFPQRQLKIFFILPRERNRENNKRRTTDVESSIKPGFDKHVHVILYLIGASHLCKLVFRARSAFLSSATTIFFLPTFFYRRYNMLVRQLDKRYTIHRVAPVLY